MDCLFCKIAAGQIPSAKVYEDELVYAFNDIAPAAPVHVLVVPKAHVMNSADQVTAQNSGLIAHIFEIAPKIARQCGLTNGYRILTNVGADAGQTVWHLHFHIIGGKELGPNA